MENPFDVILKRLERIEQALEQLNSAASRSETVNENDEFMNIEEVAKFVGLSKDTIYGLTHRRTIPHFKTGKKLYFNRAEISNWISSKRVDTLQERTK